MSGRAGIRFNHDGRNLPGFGSAGGQVTVFTGPR
jgi:hypothetical protein